MNRLGSRPPNILEKVPLKKAWTLNLAKVFVVTAGTLLALSATVVICQIASSAHRPKTLGPNGLVGVPAFPTTKVTTAAEKGKGGVPTPAGTNQADNGTIRAEHSAIDQTTSTPAPNPIPTPVPVPQTESKALISDSEFHRGEQPEFGLPGEKSLDQTGSENVERQLPKSVRKHLEKERREAERKRSRLEDMYHKNLISSEAYKKGEQEYRSEIEKYRNAVSAR